MRSAQRTLALAGALSLLVSAMTLVAQAAPRGGGGGATGSRICSQLEGKLGDRFAKRFASVGDCEAQMAPVMQAALAACATEARPSPAFRRCMRSHVRTSLASMSGRGAGARAGRVAGRLAKVRCARIQARNPAVFAKRFNVGLGCESRLMRRANTVIAGCAGVAEPRTAEFKACVRAAIDAAAASNRPATATPTP